MLIIRKIATESDLLINENYIEEDESPQSIPDYLSFIYRATSKLKLIVFTLAWVLMFAFFPFWVYAFRLPMIEYEYFTNVFTFIFFFFCFFSWVIFLMNHFSPVAATIELFRPTTQSIPTEDLKGKSVTVALSSIFCREKCFHIVRNFLGITNSWLTLDSVLEKTFLPNGEKTEVNYVHYILDNTGAPGSLALLLRFLFKINFYSLSNYLISF